MTLFLFLYMDQSVFPIPWMVIFDSSSYFKDKIGTLQSVFWSVNSTAGVLVRFSK